MSLSKKIMRRVALPIIFALLVVAAVSSVPLFILYPQWVDDIIDDLQDNRLKVVKQNSQQISNTIRSNIQIQINFVSVFKDFLKNLDSLPLKPIQNYTQVPNCQNAYIYEGQADFDQTMWYLNTTYTEIHSDSSQQEKYKICQTISTIMKPLTLDSLVRQTYTAWNDDGFFCITPAFSYQFYRKETQLCKQYDTIGFEPRCRPWFQQTLKGTNSQAFILAQPYSFAGTGLLGQTACGGIWNDTFLEQAVCLDFTIDIYTEVPLPRDSYIYMLDTNGTVFYHTDWNSSADFPSIFQLQFPGSYMGKQEEVDYFEEVILPLFYENKESGGTYQKQTEKVQDLNRSVGVTPIITLQQGENIHQFSLGVSTFNTIIQNQLKDLRSDLITLLVAQEVIYFGAITLVAILTIFSSSLIASSVLKPLNQLSQITDRLLGEDLQAKIPIRVQYSQLINKVFQVFRGLKTILKFRKQIYFKGVEAQMLINFADAYQLFDYYSNFRGMEICMCHISEIHYKNERYSQARNAMQLAISHAEKTSEGVDLRLHERLASIWIDSALFGEQNTWNQATHSFMMLLQFGQLQIQLKYIICLAAVRQMKEAQRRLTDIKEVIDFDSPLYELMVFTQGCIAQSYGRIKQAALIYTQTVSLKPNYDPWVRKACLHKLRCFFELKRYPRTKIKEIFHIKPKKREITFLLDYSMGIKGSKLRKSIAGCLNVMEILNSTDRINFMLYNRMVDVLFEQTYNNRNFQQIRNALVKQVSPRGAGCLLDAICTACKLYGKPEIEEETRISYEKQVFEYQKWLFVISTGESKSRKSESDALAALKRIGCVCIFVGINLQQKDVDFLQRIQQEVQVYVFLNDGQKPITQIFKEALRVLAPSPIIY